MPTELEPTPKRLKVNRDLCQTAATCLAFKFFELDDEAKAVILTQNGQNSDQPGNPQSDSEGLVELENLAHLEGLSDLEIQTMVMESAKLCPFGAIIVYSQTGEQLWPLDLTSEPL